MAKIKIIEAQQHHIDTMKSNMRKTDNNETLASHGIGAGVALQIGFDISELSWVCLVDGYPVLAAGVVSSSILSPIGCPWMLSTNQLEKPHAGRVLARRCRKYIAKMLAGFAMLENYVDIRNTLAIKWLKWCGFSFDTPVPYGVEGRLFNRFYMRKD